MNDVEKSHLMLLSHLNNFEMMAFKYIKMPSAFHSIQRSIKSIKKQLDNNYNWQVK